MAPGPGNTALPLADPALSLQTGSNGHDDTAGSPAGNAPVEGESLNIDPSTAAAAATAVASQPIAIQQRSARPQQAVATSAQSNSPSANNSYMDPLSQHIFMRTNTNPYQASAKFRPQTARPDSSGPDGLSPTTESAARFGLPSSDVGKDKKKGFLGRLSMRGSRRKDAANDQSSELGEPRTEGSNAHVFSSLVDSAGYTPHHKEPPRYIRVKAHNKKTREFDRMFLAQELIGTRPPETATDNKIPVVTISTAAQGRKKAATGGAVWATEFSKDGKYLAAGGRDHVVRVWAVIATADDRKAQEEEEAQSGGAGERLSAPVFREKPVQEFRGHTGEILDLSWSKNNFLLSTSMDKMVRLWHVSRGECLCAFKHKELVSKVAFHPRDDRFFLAGCLDATLRLWSIPDKTVAFSAQMSDMITAVAFSPDGTMALAGLLNGFCYLLETEGLKPLTQIHVRSSRGRNAKGSKITGIVSMVPPRAKPADAVVLISSTDSRVRVYSLRNKTLDAKFKGHEHTSSQLFASFGDDAKHVICGSENGKVFIWDVGALDLVVRDKYPCEVFDAHADVVTTAVFAPTATRQLLGASGDPIYDLCNPPPITLLSLEEARASQASPSGLSDQTAHPDSETGALPAAPVPQRARPEESPAYIARSTHYDGNIIVTSDDSGIIKVFRQDCAADKRKHESWETGSTFSRKLAGGTGLVARSSSLAARTSFSSAARSSRRGSITQQLLLQQLQPHSPQGGGGPGSVGGSAPQLAGSSDRILSWRQEIEGNSRPNSFVGGGITPAARSERSISPTKANRSTLGGGGGGGGLASSARKQPYTTTMSSPLSSHFSVNNLPVRSEPGGAGAGQQSGDRGVAAASSVASPAPLASVSASAAAVASASETPHLGAAAVAVADAKDITPPPQGRGEPEGEGDPSLGPPAPSLTFKSEPGDDLRLDPVGASYSFWNLNKWRPIAGLRASLIGGGSGSGSTDEATGSHHGAHHGAHHHSPAAVAGDRRSVVSAKSPLSQTDGAVAGDDGEDKENGAGDHHGDDENEDAKSHASDASKRPVRGRSMAAGFLSHFAPSILVTDPNNVSSREGSVDGGRLGPLRSRSSYAGSGSVVSRLSSEMTSSSDDDDDEGGGHGGGDLGDEMHCTKCGGHEFKARRVGGVQRLHCSRCGKAVE